MRFLNVQNSRFLNDFLLKVLPPQKFAIFPSLNVAITLGPIFETREAMANVTWLGDCKRVKKNNTALEAIFYLCEE